MCIRAFEHRPSAGMQACVSVISLQLMDRFSWSALMMVLFLVCLYWTHFTFKKKKYSCLAACTYTYSFKVLVPAYSINLTAVVTCYFSDQIWLSLSEKRCRLKHKQSKQEWLWPESFCNYGNRRWYKPSGAMLRKGWRTRFGNDQSHDLLSSSTPPA